MEEIVISATEVFRLAAIGPCLFIIVYLFFTARNLSNVFLPFLFFVSLTLRFLLPVLAIFPEFDEKVISAINVFNEQLWPQLSFLLIMQFILRRVPPPLYWLVLAVPIIGSYHIFYLSIFEEEGCFSSGLCLPTSDLVMLYRIFSGSLVFLLLISFVGRIPIVGEKDVIRRHKYWIIIMLIIYNILILFIDLAIVAEAMLFEEAVFVKTMIGITFAYLAPSSVFRVFDASLKIKPVGTEVAKQDKKYANKILEIIEEEKPYRDMNFDRGKLADQMAMTEQRLSRIINNHFGKTFTEMMNEYRVNDAMERLENTDDRITDISYESGFKSIASFNRVFKDFTNVSPKEYRRNSKLHLG